jgi:peptide/histidine transporter 3/4
MSVDLNPKEGELCLVDSYTPSFILREMKYFQTLKKREENIMTIAGHDVLIVGSGRTTITLSMGTQITMEDALLYTDSTRRDVRKNGFHVETHMDNKEEFLLFTKLTGYGKQICEKISSLQTGFTLYT